MPPISVTCTFVGDDGRACGSRTVVAAYFTDDPIRGMQHVSSLCSEHDSKDAQVFAKQQKWTRFEVRR